jgi:SAM-dependent methyltransferase
LRQNRRYDRAAKPFRNAVAPIRTVTVRLFERRLGFRSQKRLEAGELGYEEGPPYLASSWLMLRELFRNLEVAQDDVFADIGSGKGRVVFMAARRPFKRVLGVERSAQLNAIARTNIDRNRHRLVCPDVQLHTVDVLDWEIPPDLSVVYLYYPFDLDVLDPLLAKLVESIDRYPRPLRIIYNACSPEERETILATGRARQVSFRLPLYVRHRFDRVWMALLLPATWSSDHADVPTA